MKAALDRIWERFDLVNLLERFFLSFLPDALVAAVTFTAFYLLWRGANRAAMVVLRKTDMVPTGARFIQMVLRFAVLMVGAVTALAQLGINTGSLLASLGVAGLTIGFAARDALSNIISGLFIFWDRPFVIGDLIEVDNRYGRVQTITMRSTRVVTPDGKMLAVPNATIVNTTVASYTNFPHLRLDIGVTVGTGEDLGRVRRLLLDMVAGDTRLMPEPAPAVVVTALNDYNVSLELRVWLRSEAEHLSVRPEIRERVFETLRRAGVEMPFQTFTVVGPAGATPEPSGDAGAAPVPGGR